MSHMKDMTRMVNSAAKSACKQMGIGKATKPAKCVDDQPKEPAFEKTFRKMQALLDEARVKFHEQSDGHLCQAKKALDVVEKRYSKAWAIHQKKLKG